MWLGGTAFPQYFATISSIFSTSECPTYSDNESKLEVRIITVSTQIQYYSGHFINKIGIFQYNNITY